MCGAAQNDRRALSRIFISSTEDPFFLLIQTFIPHKIRNLSEAVLNNGT